MEKMKCLTCYNYVQALTNHGLLKSYAGAQIHILLAMKVHVSQLMFQNKTKIQEIQVIISS